MWLACEQLIAPRPLARPGQKIHSALALALLGLCRAWLGHGRRWPRPLPRGNAGSGPAAAAGRAASPDNAVPPACVATGGPLPDTAGCNSAAADGTARSTARILSAGRCAHSNGEVDSTCRTGDTQMGPREVLLPKVKPRRRAANSPPRRFYWHCGLSIATAGVRSQAQTTTGRDAGR